MKSGRWIGRRRRLPEIDALEQWVREHAERQAVNFPVQGEVAELLKVVMNILEHGSKYMKSIPEWTEQVPNVDKLKEHGCELLLQVHDEVVLQTPEEYVEEDTVIVQAVMAAALHNMFKKVKTGASVGNGDNWSEAKH